MTKPKNIVCVVHSDPGHGWLAVKTKDLRPLSINDKITQYSYLSNAGTIAYLEQDCDAHTFVTAAYTAGYTVTIKYKPQTKNRSPIRNYRSYSAWGIK